MEREVERGEEVRPFRFSGYNGYYAGSVSFGRRYDGDILRLSSAAAKEHWAQSVLFSTNVSRLDVQVTVRPPEGTQRRLLKHHQQIRRLQRKRGRPATFKFWYGPSGPEAAMLGSRQSDFFGRIYDKGIESRLPEYEGTLRYEVELKRSPAKALSAQLDQTEFSEAIIASVVHKFVSVRGCRLSTWSNIEGATLDAGSSLNIRDRDINVCSQESPFASRKSVRDLGEGRARRRALWLYNCVRPSVKEFVERGETEMVLGALGLTNVTQPSSVLSDESWADFNKWR